MKWKYLKRKSKKTMNVTQIHSSTSTFYMKSTITATNNQVTHFSTKYTPILTTIHTSCNLTLSGLFFHERENLLKPSNIHDYMSAHKYTVIPSRFCGICEQKGTPIN